MAGLQTNLHMYLPKLNLENQPTFSVSCPMENETEMALKAVEPRRFFCLQWSIEGQSIQPKHIIFTTIFPHTVQPTVVCSQPLCTYSGIFSPKKPGFSEINFFSKKNKKFFYLFSMQLFSADAMVFSKKFKIFFLTLKK